MATANVSGDEFEKQTIPFSQRYCLPDLTTGIYGQLTLISVLNSFLSIAAFFGNTLVLVALRKESSLHLPSKLLLRNLATTDICVGLIVEPLHAVLLLTIVNEHWNACRYITVVVHRTSLILCGVSLLTLTAISMDRLLALLLGLRYRQVVTLRRAYGNVIAFWAASTVASAVRFFWSSFRMWSWCKMAVISLCLVISTLSYTTIFINLRHHQHQVQDQVQQPNQTNQLNIARYRKAVFTALWLQFTLVACYLPYATLLTFPSHAKPPSSAFLALSYAHTLVFLNSTLNPILYCWKMGEVRQAVKNTIRQVLCC